MFPKPSRRVLWLALAALAFATAAPAGAQVVANDAYQVAYFDHFGFLDTARIINTGQIGSPIDAGTQQGTVCASIYFFDSNQEMISCCSCPVTANGLLNGPVAAGTVNALTGSPPAETGVVKIVADRAATCDARTITSPVEGGLRAFDAHRNGSVSFVCENGLCLIAIEILPGGTETEFQRAPLTQTEQAFLGNACSFVLYLGSGRGRCFCPNEAL